MQRSKKARNKTIAEYIEREALLKHAHIRMTRVSDTEWQKGYWDGVDDMAEYIREQPAADVTEVKHGKWMDNRNGTFTCSVCGGKASKMDYCGNCGARMDGEGK